MDFGVLKTKLEEADVLLAALRVTRNRETREAIAVEIGDIIDEIAIVAEEQSGNGDLVRKILGSITHESNYELWFVNALCVIHFIRRTKRSNRNV